MKTIKEIVENKAEIIALKKAELKTVKGGLSSINKGNLNAIKGLFKNSETKLERTIVGNTYMWMDSHDDVHGKNLFKKSISERKGNIFHLHDHEFKITSKIGEPIDIYEKDIAWKDLNVNKNGTTQALFMDTEIMKDYNLQVFNEYKENRINQHSVGMQYVKIDLAVNDEDYEGEFKTWNENIDKIGNKEHAESKGYFWLVKEAKLIEISAVLLGSNELTPTLPENIEPSDDTQKNEAEKSLQDQQIEFFKTIKI